MKLVYSFILLGAILVPFAFSFHPKLNFHYHFKTAIVSIVLIACPFMLWDMYFTALSVWGFNSQYLLGVVFYNLPIEEILFFICIPFCCLFTHHSLKVIRKGESSIPYAAPISILAGVLLLLFALVNWQGMYTLWSFLVAGISLIVLGIKKPSYLSDFWVSYVVLLLPFFIVNGLLTGTGLESPVVWYADAENMGIRILTIPIEDFFYGMTLILWNIALFETLSKKINLQYMQLKGIRKSERSIMQ